MSSYVHQVYGKFPHYKSHKSPHILKHMLNNKIVLHETEKYLLTVAREPACPDSKKELFQNV